VDYTVNLVDDRGQPLSPPEVSKRWPWRLVAYIKYGLRGSVLVDERAEALGNRNIAMWSYMVSLTPSFGLNFYNLGGDLTLGGVNNSPGCVMKITAASQSSRRIVFASSHMAGGWEGYFKIVPPTKSFEYSALGWTSQPYHEGDDPAAWGYVHPRFNGKAVVACLDGHSEMLSIEELRDMTRWSEPAAQSGDPNWGVP
jgi:hypothetical protein